MYFSYKFIQSHIDEAIQELNNPSGDAKTNDLAKTMIYWLCHHRVGHLVGKNLTRLLMDSNQKEVVSVYQYEGLDIASRIYDKMVDRAARGKYENIKKKSIAYLNRSIRNDYLRELEQQLVTPNRAGIQDKEEQKERKYNQLRRHELTDFSEFDTHANPGRSMEDQIIEQEDISNFLTLLKNKLYHNIRGKYRELQKRLIDQECEEIMTGQEKSSAADLAWLYDVTPTIVYDTKKKIKILMWVKAKELINKGHLAI